MPSAPSAVAPTDARRGWAAIAALGLVTITAYGSWFYAFGILIDPIHLDEGWSLAALGAIFAAAQIVNASNRGRQTVYVPWRWGLVMQIIRHIP